MTDINSQTGNGASGAEHAVGDANANGTGVRQTELLLIAQLELLFFAYRDFTSDPDAILEQFGFGRAHHRVLHFVDRNPGLRVADLLDILKITKQSLAPVLKQLVDEGYITQQAGQTDRRERLLFATTDGRALAGQLMRPQLSRVAEALRAAGGQAPEVVRNFLYHMITEDERSRVEEWLATHPSSERQPLSGPDGKPRSANRQ